MRDSIIWLGCILLMLSGIIFGICIDSNSGTLESIYKVFGSISSIATIVMVCISAIALTSWIDQFYRTKQYEHLTELQVKNFKYGFREFEKITHALKARIFQLYEISEYEQSEYNLIESDILKLKLDIQKCFQSYWRR